MADLHSVLNKYMRELREGDDGNPDAMTPGQMAAARMTSFASNSPKGMTTSEEILGQRAYAAEFDDIMNGLIKQGIDPETAHTQTVKIMNDKYNKNGYELPMSTKAQIYTGRAIDATKEAAEKSWNWAKENPQYSVPGAMIATALAAGAGGYALRKRFAKTR